MAREGDFELVTLRNGARAVRHVGHGEVMHPTVGPWEEAQRLYVEQVRLAERLCEPGPPLVIHDVGLGAATNAVAALGCARALGARRREVEVVSFEVDLAPLRLALGDRQGFSFLEPWREAAQGLMERGAWEEGGLRWRLVQGDAREWLGAPGLPRAELVYFDPFSPAANPGLWSPRALSQVRAGCREEGALLVTYSAATPTRVSLLLAGFYVGVGVPTGPKGETTVAATRREGLESPLGERWLARWRRSTARGPHGEPFTPEVEARVLEHPQWRSSE